MTRCVGIHRDGDRRRPSRVAYVADVAVSRVDEDGKAGPIKIPGTTFSR